MQIKLAVSVTRGRLVPAFSNASACWNFAGVFRSGEGSGRRVGDAGWACALRTRGQGDDRDRAGWRRRCVVGGAGGDLGLSGLVVRCGAVSATVSLAPPSDDRLCGLVAGEQRTGAWRGRSAASESGGDGLRASTPAAIRSGWRSSPRGRTRRQRTRGVGRWFSGAGSPTTSRSLPPTGSSFASSLNSAGRVVSGRFGRLHRGSAQRYCAELCTVARAEIARADAREAKPAPCRPVVQTFGADLRYRRALRAARLESPAAGSVRARSVSRRS